jgi:amino acid adenylation domain-containing protein
MNMPQTLLTAFLRSSEEFLNCEAIDVGGQATTYENLANRAKSLGATVRRALPSAEIPLTAVFGYRSQTAYAGVLGALMAGHGYVPLNPTFPIARTRVMLERAMCRPLIVDARSEPQLERLLSGFPVPLVVICPDQNDVSELAEKLPKHQVIGAAELADAAEWTPRNIDVHSIAYLLFTSGSTGQPKGVMVSHANVLHYIDYVTKRYGIDSSDRLSQTFDLTFDLSAHDLFVTWGSGACLCVPTQKQMIKPGAFINEARLTAWFSVPSTAMFMRKLGELKPDMYPGLRLTLFCGEALPVDVARKWALAAPNSIIENIYGPTELTIACTAYRWDSALSPPESEHGVVPIGEPFAEMESLIVDEQLREVEDGIAGELVMTGPQLSLGYWQDRKRTEEAFVAIPDKNGTYYKTGDRVRRRGPGKPLVYLGRLDNQVKILGHRVELGEVEAAVREASGIPAVVAVGWPPSDSGAAGIEVFVEADQVDAQALLGQLKSKLPAYMVPSGIHPIKRFPLNPNGKYDRKALTAMLGSP